MIVSGLIVSISSFYFLKRYDGVGNGLMWQTRVTQNSDQEKNPKFNSLKFVLQNSLSVYTEGKIDTAL